MAHLMQRFLGQHIYIEIFKDGEAWDYVVPKAVIEAAGVLPEEFADGQVTPEVVDEILDRAIDPTMN